MNMTLLKLYRCKFTKEIHNKEGSFIYLDTVEDSEGNKFIAKLNFTEEQYDYLKEKNYLKTDTTFYIRGSMGLRVNKKDIPYLTMKVVEVLTYEDKENKVKDKGLNDKENKVKDKGLNNKEVKNKGFNNKVKDRWLDRYKNNDSIILDARAIDVVEDLHKTTIKIDLSEEKDDYIHSILVNKIGNKYVLVKGINGLIKSIVYNKKVKAYIKETINE